MWGGRTLGASVCRLLSRFASSAAAAGREKTRRPAAAKKLNHLCHFPPRFLSND
jgi:hypothetical protein